MTVVSDITRPLCVCFSCSFLTGIMLMHVNLHFLPAFDTVSPLPIPTLYLWTINSSKRTLLTITQPAKIVAWSVSLQKNKTIQNKYQEGHLLACNIVRCVMWHCPQNGDVIFVISSSAQWRFSACYITEDMQVACLFWCTFSATSSSEMISRSPFNIQTEDNCHSSPTV